ncbi:MAG: hypothetical protein HOI05_05750 [Nitrosopumilus sp.]|jgi:hypothetical protein|nr:hypothetical protein [Nitrosopumilus sp.]MBT4298894.1 hypothetical protein [Nitrosopumilus sp.]MBT6195299.1 hypothetical protein [Nitrosopumilus sp.]MBT7920389.1 hypothetical protein [Nitrosopumilus sp.]
MSFEIDWCRNFFNISWAREQDKLVLLVVFEDKKMAVNISKEIESWSEKFTRLTIIEKEGDEFAICCYEDPQISKSDKKIGLFITGMRQSTGYEYTKIIIEDKSTLLQIVHAEDFLDIKTHQEVSKLVPLRKCRIISEKDLKKQEFYYEKIASLNKKSDEDSKK